MCTNQTSLRGVSSTIGWTLTQLYFRSEWVRPDQFECVRSGSRSSVSEHVNHHRNHHNSQEHRQHDGRLWGHLHTRTLAYTVLRNARNCVAVMACGQIWLQLWNKEDNRTILSKHPKQSSSLWLEQNSRIFPVILQVCGTSTRSAWYTGKMALYSSVKHTISTFLHQIISFETLWCSLTTGKLQNISTL